MSINKKTEDIVYTRGYTLLLDTETSNAQKSDKFNPNGNMVFDLGFLILDEKLNVVEEYQVLNSDIYENSAYMDNYFFGQEKLAWYKDSNIKILNTIEIQAEVQEILKKYNITTIAAYNVNYDVRVIRETAKNFGSNEWINFELYKVIDLYHMACQALANNEEYIVFCMENGKCSAAGNVQGTAEAVYSFIKDDKAFIEDHTALSDCYIERDIYKWVLDKEKEKGIIYKTNPNPAAWRLLQRKKG